VEVAKTPGTGFSLAGTNAGNCKFDRGTVAANGVAAVAVSFPNMQPTDKVMLTPTASTPFAETSVIAHARSARHK